MLRHTLYDATKLDIEKSLKDLMLYYGLKRLFRQSI